MRSPSRMALAWVLAALPMASAIAADPPPTTAKQPSAKRAKDVRRARVIGTHQIDRYAAIEDLQDSLNANPKALADWIILGELAHEVALDAPPDRAAKYFQISRDAYEHALALAPDKPGLKAAVQFARDYELGADRFRQSRDRATQIYLDARRRDLAATDYVPAVRVIPSTPPDRVLPQFGSPGVLVSPQPAQTATPGSGEDTGLADAAVGIAPDTAPAVTPAPGATASTDAANFGARLIYTSPYTFFYQPLYHARRKSPYSYQQYSSAYYPPGFDANTDAGPVPVTIQRYVQEQMLDSSKRPAQTDDPTFAPTPNR
jgi:hypothetical protein